MHFILTSHGWFTTRTLTIKDSIHHPAAAVALTAAHNRVAAGSNRQPCT
ncbi:hypothetical protein ACEYW6_29730 [Nostoc sp. UIC 10607]